MKCECEPLYFAGSICDIDLRPCSYSPCLNSIKCENIFEKQKEIDFRCECKDSSKYYGKRCEHKVNLCQNETCSGNGVCKIQNENQLNETIRCECFGKSSFEGDKCETKSTKMIVHESTVKTTAYIAIGSIFAFYIFIFLIDLHTFLTKSRSIQRTNNKNKQNRISKNLNTKAVKLVYVP